MKKLQCEICGGPLMMEDGIAECQSCGMRFSKEEVKKMVVELSGPIKIDGEVKVSGVDDADVLFHRAKDFERLGDRSAVKRTYQQMTETYPGDPRGWVGLAELSASPELITRRVHRYFCLACKTFEKYTEGISYRPLACKQCKVYGRWADGELPLQLEIRKVEIMCESCAKEVTHYMSQAMKVAGESLQSELQAYHARLLEQHHSNTQKLLGEAEDWNRKSQEEIDSWCEKQLELEVRRKAEAEQERAVKEQEKAAEKASKQLQWQIIEQQWSRRNADFLNQFSSAAIAELFGLQEHSFIGFLTAEEPNGAGWVAQWCTPIELNLTYAFGNRLAGTYAYHNKQYSGGSKKRKGSFDVTIGYDTKVISGDVRPLMDGKEMIVRGLFSTKKVIYHYSSDKE